ncbi:hypothetical protein F5883DRAFT_695001 [Diaporthe sp. PMI_573]|nr:hypothetical protein F5883DRAFT_695001 [Diaporthaceae sp. PMI_573]
MPEALEYTLQSAQIIGIPDSITGEACVAVVDTSKSQNFSKLQLQLDVSKHIGPEFIFVHILTLQDLGISDFPLGPGGKVRKPVLRQMVLEYLNKTKLPETLANGISESTKDQQRQDYWINLVISVWADLLHIDASELNADFRLEHFTDSLTAMRYCFEIERMTSKRLTVEDVRGSPTIRSQAKLISGASTETHVAGKTNSDFPQRTGPPTLADVFVCRGQESKFQEIQDLAKPILEGHGLTWDQDVQECFLTLPLWRAFVLLPPTRTFNLCFAFEVYDLEFSEVREALLEILKVQPMPVSTGVNLNNQLVFLKLRHSDHVLDKVITREPDFESVDEAVEYRIHEPFKLVAHPPEMMGRFGISTILGNSVESGSVHVVTLSLSHAICDGMSNGILISELEAQVQLLRARKNGEVAPPPHVSPRFIPYKLVCDMYESLDHSLAAETSRKLIASRYHGVAKESVTPWPVFDPTKMLSIFGSDSSRGTDVYYGGINIQRQRRVPGILSLHETHGIPPAVALKPFQDAWTQTQLPNPLLIGGPTTVLTWERLKLEDDKVTILDILRRVLAEDLEVAPHTHVFNSHEGIIAHLPPEDAAYVRESRCFDPKLALNHVPDVGRFTGSDGLKSLKLRGVSFFGTGVTPLQSGFDTGDRELCVIAGLVDDVQWDDPEREVGGFEETILRTLGDIVKPENWDAAAFRFAEPVEV